MHYTCITIPTHDLCNDKVNPFNESSYLHKRTLMLPNCLKHDCRIARCLQGVQQEVREEGATREDMLAMVLAKAGIASPLAKGERKKEEGRNPLSANGERKKPHAWAQCKEVPHRPSQGD